MPAPARPPPKPPNKLRQTNLWCIVAVGPSISLQIRLVLIDSDKRLKIPRQKALFWRRSKHPSQTARYGRSAAATRPTLSDRPIPLGHSRLQLVPWDPLAQALALASMFRPSPTPARRDCSLGRSLRLNLGRLGRRHQANPWPRFSYQILLRVVVKGTPTGAAPVMAVRLPLEPSSSHTPTDGTREAGLRAKNNA